MSATWDEDGKLMTEAWYEAGKLNGKFFQKMPMEKRSSSIIKRISAMDFIKFSILPERVLTSKLLSKQTMFLESHKDKFSNLMKKATRSARHPMSMV
jgi:hypothetical protein